MFNEQDDDLPSNEEQYERIKKRIREKSAHDFILETLKQKKKGYEKKSQTNTASNRGDLSQFNLLVCVITSYSYSDTKIIAKKFLERIRFNIREMVKNECQNKKKKKDYQYKHSHLYMIYCKKSIVLLLFCWLIRMSNGKIDIKLSNKFVVFGDDASLICTYDDNETHSISWIKEPENMLLTIGKSSLDREKYIPSQMTVNNRSLYILIINNFSIGDLARYKCQVDFSSTLFDLSLDNRFVYRPGNHEMISYLSKGSGFLNVTMKMEKVYPDPICEMSLEGYNYTYKASTTLTKSSELYVAVLSTMFPADDINCTVIIKINCSLSATSLVLWRNFTICQEDDNRYFTQSNVTMVILVVVGSCFVIVLLLVFIYKRKRMCSNYTTVENGDNGNNKE